jgi:hypothetical protein
MRQVIILGIIAFNWFTAGFAQDNSPLRKIYAVRTHETIRIDGILNENLWQRPGFTGFSQREPDEGAAPTQRCTFWVAYDEEAIYCAMKYEDTHPDSIMARLVRRDFIWGDPSDGCVLYLDTFRDLRNGYFFYVSAAGALADGLIENDVNQPNDLTWDAVWEGVPRVSAEGYCVEMRIPYSQLRFPEGDSQIWGVNVERFISRRAETDMIAYTPRNESGFASRFPELVGIQGISPAARVEALPYITSRAEYVGNDPTDPFNPGRKYIFGGGLDIRAGLGSSLTFNGTINPDFGQVEVDPAVVNLTDVESSFEEKRPFFTEGVTLYKFGQGGSRSNPSYNWQAPQLFYSRRIGRAPQGRLPVYDYADAPSGTHILGAAKISGKILEDWRIGMIHSLTEREYARVSLDGVESRPELEPLTYYGVLRTQRDFDGGRENIGFLATYTNRFFNDQSLSNAINKSAVVGGVDGFTFLDAEQTYVLTGWGGVTRVSGTTARMVALQRSSGHYFQRPDASHLGVDSAATSLTGYAGRLMLNKNRGAIVLNSAIGVMSPRFDVNDLGYQAFGDVINAHINAGYRWTTPTEFYLNAGMSAATFASWDFGGNNTARGYWLGSFITLRNLYGANLLASYSPQTYNSRRTRGGPLTLNPVTRLVDLYLYTDNRLWYTINWEGFLRTGDDLASRSLVLSLELKVTPTLTFSVGPQIQKDSYGAQWVGAFTDPAATETYQKRYLFAHLEQTTLVADIRVDWIISPSLSFQVYLQPLISSGRYTDFKSLSRPKTYEFLKYGDNGSTVTPGYSSTGELLGYELDPDGQGPALPSTIANPDFNIVSLRGNAVLRWEYVAGSVVYLVWTQSRADYEPIGDFELRRSMSHLFEVKPDNIFMLKFSYWLGM